MKASENFLNLNNFKNLDHNHIRVAKINGAKTGLEIYESIEMSKYIERKYRTFRRPDCIWKGPNMETHLALNGYDYDFNYTLLSQIIKEFGKKKVWSAVNSLGLIIINH